MGLEVDYKVVVYGIINKIGQKEKDQIKFVTDLLNCSSILMVLVYNCVVDFSLPIGKVCSQYDGDILYGSSCLTILYD